MIDRLPYYLEVLLAGGFLTANSWGDEDEQTIGWRIEPRIIGFIGGNLVKDIYFSIDFETHLCSFSFSTNDDRCYNSGWIAVPETLYSFKQQLVVLLAKADK